MAAIRTIKVRRESGETVPVRMAEGTYWEVTTENRAGDCWTYSLVCADSRREALNIAEMLIGEKAIESRSLSIAEAAVLTLNDMAVIA